MRLAALLCSCVLLASSASAEVARVVVERRADERRPHVSRLAQRLAVDPAAGYSPGGTYIGSRCHGVRHGRRDS